MTTELTDENGDIILKEHKFFNAMGGRKYFLLIILSFFFIIFAGVTFKINQPEYWTYLTHFTSAYFWLIIGYIGLNVGQKGLDKIKPKNF